MSIETQVNKTIDSKKEEKEEEDSIDELQDQFDAKYKKLSLLDNSKTAKYHQLYDELQILIKKIKYLIRSD
jgi:hypothetical protein